MTPGQVGGLQKTITQPALPARAFQILSLLPSFTIFYSVTREGFENVFRKNKKVVRSLLDLLSEFVHLSDWKSSPQFRVPAVSPESLCFCWKNFQKLLHEVRAGSQEWRQRFNWLPCSLGHVRSMKTTLWAWRGLFSPKPGILAVTDHFCELRTTQASVHAEWTLCTGIWAAFTEYYKEEYNVVKGKVSQVDSAEKDWWLQLRFI